VKLTDKALADFNQHVLNEYPKEAVGVLVHDEFVACKNIDEQPTQHFRVSGTQLAEIGANKGRITALLHSHPYDIRRPPKFDAVWPTHHDMQQWLKSDIPWGIASTEGENVSPLVWLDESVIAPLEGRPFIHGIWDCYATVRDWYRLEKGYNIPNFPRGMEWWDKGGNHYEDNFRAAGFIEIPRKEIQIGDSVLFQVRSPVINHAAVITGSNEILHHLFHRLSGKDRFDRWERLSAKFVRYVGPDK